MCIQYVSFECDTEIHNDMKKFFSISEGKLVIYQIRGRFAKFLGLKENW